MINILIPVIVALLLIPNMHGVILKWHNLHLPSTPLTDVEAEKMRQVYIKRASTLWHGITLTMRVFLWLAIWFISDRNYWITGTVIVISCLFYPVNINLINKWKWYYVGKTAWYDRLIRKVFFFVNFD